MTWEIYLLSLKDKVRELAKADDDPVKTLEEAVLFHLGEMPEISSPEEIVDSPMFQSVLMDKDSLTPNQFPMKVKAMQLDEDPGTLRDWIDQVLS